jgi:hypothetical protein
MMHPDLSWPAFLGWPLQTSIIEKQIYRLFIYFPGNKVKSIRGFYNAYSLPIPINLNLQDLLVRRSMAECGKSQIAVWLISIVLVTFNKYRRLLTAIRNWPRRRNMSEVYCLTAYLMVKSVSIKNSFRQPHWAATLSVTIGWMKTPLSYP